jgi:hypothetical protein
MSLCRQEHGFEQDAPKAMTLETIFAIDGNGAIATRTVTIGSRAAHSGFV